jgi:hypothetical protein
VRRSIPGYLLVIDEDAEPAETTAVYAGCRTDSDIRAGLRSGW